jgi:hypothetical protein
MNRLLSCSCLSAGLFFCAGILFADTFGSGGNSFDIDFVTIGNPGNPPDAHPNRIGLLLGNQLSTNCNRSRGVI